MKLKKRHGDIVDAVNRHGRVGVEQLATRFGVSAETIRRDLTFLNDAGRLQKVHGGAKRARLFTEASFEDRMGEDAGAKLLIATGDTPARAAAESLGISPARYQLVALATSVASDFRAADRPG